MEDLPKIVQNRLRTAPPGEHPDANLLAAFCENSINPRERAGIMEHLATCAECREITSLAAPEEEMAMAGMAMAAAVGRAAPVPLPVRRSLNFRWGALAACVVIVAGVVWTTYRPGKRAVSALPVGAVSSSKASNAEVAKLEEHPSELRYQSESARRAEQQLEARVPRKSSAQSRDERALSQAVEETGVAQVASSSAPAAAPPPPPETTLTKSQSEAAKILAMPASPKSAAKSNEIAADTSTAVQLRKEQLEKSEEKDKKRIAAGGALTDTVETTAGSAFSGSEGPATLTSAVQSSVMRWTLSHGRLRRSIDAGHNWEDVPVDQNANFRALSVMGEELWVGGKQGALYHSPDNGAHWVRVVPSSGNESLKEDVVRLEFADADHGKVITPKGEWRTNNCGATWEKTPKE